MYIKKSVLVVCSIVLVVAVAIGTVMLVNPFGVLNFEDFLKFRVGVAALDRFYYEKIEPEKLVDGALLGATYSTEDPYTVYMTKDEAESFMESVESDDYSGVGLYITPSEDGQGITVISALANSPAEEMGIVSGDKILEVDGESVNGKNLQQVANEMKGAEGTKVTLKILKKSTGKTADIVLKRAQIKRETVTSKMLDDKNAYIQITQFGVNTAHEFIEHFNTLVGDGMKRLVVDLRNNPGGYMEIAVEIADAFIDEGEIVYTMDKNGTKNSHLAKKGKTELPIVILINEGSASASEILVGALCDHNLAKTVGEKTFGKGVTQIPYELWDGSVIKITNSRYYTPKGVCIDHEGIVPDFEVKMSEEEYLNISESNLSNDRQLKKAVEILNSK
ncbi:MAG: S41 family peptidase [Clostridia bacterium]|nr:S41 family peptidase [Clostridia bacterium]